MAAGDVYPNVIINENTFVCITLFVSKQRDSDDGRIVTLVLSSEGAALLKKAPTPAHGLLPEALRP